MNESVKFYCHPSALLVTVVAPVAPSWLLCKHRLTFDSLSLPVPKLFYSYSSNSSHGENISGRLNELSRFIVGLSQIYWQKSLGRSAAVRKENSLLPGRTLVLSGEVEFQQLHQSSKAHFLSKAKHSCHRASICALEKKRNEKNNTKCDNQLHTARRIHSAPHWCVEWKSFTIKHWYFALTLS